MSMEFVMGNSLETLPKTIDFNFEELKGQLAESLALYTGLVVTEDGIKGAKEDRAKLNKLREALEIKGRPKYSVRPRAICWAMASQWPSSQVASL